MVKEIVRVSWRLQYIIRLYFQIIHSNKISLITSQPCVVITILLTYSQAGPAYRWDVLHEYWVGDPAVSFHSSFHSCDWESRRYPKCLGLLATKEVQLDIQAPGSGPCTTAIWGVNQ